MPDKPNKSITKLSKMISTLDLSQNLAEGVLTISNVVLIFGALLVLLGTIGAIFSTGILDRYKDERISENEVNTEKAKADSASANALSEKAKEDAAIANKEAAKANSRAALLLKEAEEAKLEQEKLKAKLAWRRLSLEQHSRLAEIFKKRLLDVDVASPISDIEAGIFANDIYRTLKETGSTTNLIAAGYTTPPIGIFVSQTLNGDSAYLISALASVGIHAELASSMPRLTIIVGSRPYAF